MRVMQVLALLLMVVSALSFGLTIYNTLTTEWNVGERFWDMGWYHGNWWEGTLDFLPWFGEHYNWFFGYYYQSFTVNDFNPLKSFYSPFPSVLGGIYLLICGIVLWKVKTENPAQWLGCRNMRDKQCVLRVSMLIIGGALSLFFSMFVMHYPPYDARGNEVYPFQQYGFPLALLGIALLALGTVGFFSVIKENPRLPRFFEPQPPQQS
jgi:hypothetical protein